MVKGNTSKRCQQQCVLFNDTATTEIYTLPLHDALPILPSPVRAASWLKRPSSEMRPSPVRASASPSKFSMRMRSEEHTLKLQSRQYLVCRLLLEKKYIRTFHRFVSPILFPVINPPPADS